MILMDYVSLKGFIIFTINMHQTIALEVIKYWGHYSTKDFITFKNEPVALFPDCSLDAGGAYSGSTIIKDNKMYVTIP